MKIGLLFLVLLSGCAAHRRHVFPVVDSGAEAYVLPNVGNPDCLRGFKRGVSINKQYIWCMRVCKQ